MNVCHQCIRSDDPTVTPRAHSAFQAAAVAYPSHSRTKMQMAALPPPPKKPHSSGRASVHSHSHMAVAALGSASDHSRHMQAADWGRASDHSRCHKGSVVGRRLGYPWNHTCTRGRRCTPPAHRCTGPCSQCTWVGSTCPGSKAVPTRRGAGGWGTSTPWTALAWS